MNKEELERRKKVLLDTIQEERRSYRMLISTLQGFENADADCYQITMHSQWVESDEMFAIPSEKIHGAFPMVIRGEMAASLVKMAIAALKEDIDYNEGLINELYHAE